MKFMSKLLILSVLALLILEPALLAKGQQTQRERVNLKLQDVKIEDFIKMVGKVVDKNILLSQPIPGTLNFVSSSPIYKDELMDILISVLVKKGFTIIQDGSFLKVERANVAVKKNLPIGYSKDSLMRTEFIEVRNENVDIIAAKVRQFLSEGGKLLTIKETNTMIVSDYPDNINVIKKVVRKIESQSVRNKQVEFIPLQNAKASRLASSIGTISKNIINQKVAANKVDILSDDATNSIILMASQKNINKLKPIVERLDAKDESFSQRLTVLPLENSEATNVVKSLTAILDKKKYAKEAEKPMVSVYDELNAIVVSATEQDINDIKEMIKILDVVKPQVFVRARIIELNQNQSQQVGVKYGLAGGAATSSGLFTFAANLGGPALAFNPGDLGINTGSYDSGIAFGATIDFLAGEGAAQTLSEPTLLCVNNQESSIYVGKTEPVISSSAQGNQTTDLARNTYTREDIGLTLKIKPRLSSGNKVTLITTTKLEDISNSSIVGLPSTTKREVLTTAIVNDGESVIIGGLIHHKDKNEEQGIPGLRHIPWLGQLFRWNNTAEEEINLVIILTPYIVRSNSDMPRLRKMLAQLDKIQDDYKALIERKLNERIKEIEEKKEGKGESTSTSDAKHSDTELNI
jgi:general secretion pathway protein D